MEIETPAAWRETMEPIIRTICERGLQEPGEVAAAVVRLMGLLPFDLADVAEDDQDGSKATELSRLTHLLDDWTTRTLGDIAQRAALETRWLTDEDELDLDATQASAGSPQFRVLAGGTSEEV